MKSGLDPRLKKGARCWGGVYVRRATTAAEVSAVPGSAARTLVVSRAAAPPRDSAGMGMTPPPTFAIRTRSPEGVHLLTMRVRFLQRSGGRGGARVSMGEG